MSKGSATAHAAKKRLEEAKLFATVWREQATSIVSGWLVRTTPYDALDEAPGEADEEWAWIDSLDEPQTGDQIAFTMMGERPVILGKIKQAAATEAIISRPFSAPSFNSPVLKVDRNNTNFTNTDTGADADAVSTTIVLPTGTWTIYAMGSATCFHSAIADFQVKVSINGDVGASSTLASGSAAGDRITLNPVHAVTGIASGTITCKIVFRSGTAGTITVDTSSLFIVAMRTA